MLSSGSAKHTGPFTLQLPLSVSLGVGSLLLLTSGHSDLLVSRNHSEAVAQTSHFSMTRPLFKIPYMCQKCSFHYLFLDL